ncbi:hypothetical protein RFI_21837 [Reticulomyxa filosa]|uniref:Uncharacterized protein n=1 Tax=Reticulomyxa filosa TaxID=46433 RepID=X6MPD1_RETFI|nr:hypothetical protein RFI_21837 [Reticulomyxa filosa]|eukprot:ETO15526.1 hypothetical protein RFI_21837 [Reticulomyxa filosa]
MQPSVLLTNDVSQLHYQQILADIGQWWIIFFFNTFLHCDYTQYYLLTLVIYCKGGKKILRGTKKKRNRLNENWIIVENWLVLMHYLTQLWSGCFNLTQIKQKLLNKMIIDNMLQVFLRLENFEINIVKYDNHYRNEAFGENEKKSIRVVCDKLYCRKEVPKHWDLQIEILLFESIAYHHLQLIPVISFFKDKSENQIEFICIFYTFRFKILKFKNFYNEYNLMKNVVWAEERSC